MAVNDLFITAKNNIFKHVIIGYGIYCFCQQSCLFIRHEYIITGNMKLLLSVSGKTDLVGGWGWRVEDSHDRGRGGGGGCMPNFEKRTHVSQIQESLLN